MIKQVNHYQGGEMSAIIKKVKCMYGGKAQIMLRNIDGIIEGRCSLAYTAKCKAEQYEKQLTFMDKLDGNTAYYVQQKNLEFLREDGCAEPGWYDVKKPFLQSIFSTYSHDSYRKCKFSVGFWMPY